MRFLLAALVLAAAAPLFAAQRKCSNGREPKLSGDLFSPVECSTATTAAAILPGLPVVLGAKDVADLKELDGHWEGVLIHALGRYQLLLTVKTAWSKTELTLDTKEMQFHERLSDKLTLIPGKERGVYEGVLTTTLAPEASLKGQARVGGSVAAEVPVSTAAAKALTPNRQADIAFSNGAIHRVIFAVKDKTELRVRAFSGVPSAPLQTFELVLKKTKREAL